MAGIVQNALGTTGLTQTSALDPVVTPAPSDLSTTTTPAPTTTYSPTKMSDPATWTTTPDQTVAGQISNLTDPNSPLIQQARARADMRSNERGLLNSSIATTAADSAAYDVALPIAQADAANASKVAGYNANQKNEFAVKNQDTSTQVGLNNAQQSNQVAVANLNQQTQLKVKQLDQAQQVQLAKLENDSKALLQNSNVAANAYAKYADRLYNNSVNTNMDANARFTADQAAFNQYQQQLSLAAALVNVPDVSAQLTFTELNPTTNAPATTVGAPALPLNPVGGGTTVNVGSEIA